MRRSVTGPKAVSRHVLLMLLAVFLVALPAEGGDLQGLSAEESTEEGCDCCPDKTPGDGEDCCDTDGGLCCATGVSAATTLNDSFESALDVAGVAEEEPVHPGADGKGVYEFVLGAYSRERLAQPEVRLHRLRGDGAAGGEVASAQDVRDDLVGHSNG